MEYNVCQVSVAPIRSSSSDRSEIVTQLLFGETVTVIDKKGTWRKVRCSWDNYVGWTDHKLLKVITATEFEKYKEHPVYSLELAQAIMAEDHFLPILMGSSLPAYDGLKLELGDCDFTFSGQVIDPAAKRLTENMMLKIARKYLNAPYLWGGRSPFGIDCSGFTQIVFKMLGIKLSRDASQQVGQGEIIDFVEQAKPGDLAFFENKRKRIAHVGIIFPNSQIIHSHGKVRIDNIDHFGIFNEEKNKYTHRLRVIKRLLPEDMPSGAAEETAGKESQELRNQIGLF
ncbi:MAG: hypothetical protein ACI94Y_002980 [Maribacter sp.]|jgi:hypothetical protein